MPFSNFGLGKDILRAIQKAGYTRPTPVQVAAIPKVMQGNDLIAIAQTGTGKTAAFVLPMLHRISLANQQGQPRGTKALILAPTRELALQIMENIRAYGNGLPIRVAAIFGGVEEEAQIKAVRKGVDMIVATPGRLIDLMERQKVDFSMLEMLVLDEADRMLHMGFLPDIETIIKDLPKRRQTLMFSATLSKEVESLARRFLYQPKMVQIGKRSNPADTVVQCVYEVPAHLKSQMLLALLRQSHFTRVLVFVRMKDGANVLTNFLKLAGVKVARLHSSRSQEQRLQALQDFKDGKVQVLVATDIVARGIDIDGVSHVVNYDFPVNPEDYVHRIGRTGRAEAQGEAISFVPKGDLNLLGMTELSIGQRLERKRLRGFDYHATTPAPAAGEKPEKRDWRKRTREIEAKQTAKSAPKKPASKKPTDKRGRK
ncbi:MAG: DEAD/DEAH box helicase [Luteolibacter sp.]|uniref:DEAD/DEAH box helicase n=1 Tax=Luteolibacter sp. TaxID=1962973 RepID=UPI003266299F